MRQETECTNDLEHGVLAVVREKGAVKPYDILDVLNRDRKTDAPWIYQSEVARAIWRLVDQGRIIFRPGSGIALADEASSAAI